MTIVRAIVSLSLLTSASTAWSACDQTINAGADIQSALNGLGSWKTLCLNPGNYYPASRITLQTGQRLKGNVSDPYITQVKIISSADRAIVAADYSWVDHLAIRSASGVLPTYGILGHGVSDVTIWSVDISDVLISIGVNANASDVLITNVFTRKNGSLSNGKADPNIWISNKFERDCPVGIVPRKRERAWWRW